MGCSSSKHFEKRRLMDVRISPPRIVTATPSTKNVDHTLEYYHQHFVALTASHGVLEFVEATKSTAHSRVGSLAEMYDKLRSLETAAATLSCEVNKLQNSTSVNVCKDEEKEETIDRLSDIGNAGEKMKRRKNIDRQKLLQAKDATTLISVLSKRNEEDEYANENDTIGTHRPITGRMTQRSVTLKRNPLESLPLQEFSSPVGERTKKNTAVEGANDGGMLSVPVSSGVRAPTSIKSSTDHRHEKKHVTALSPRSTSKSLALSISPRSTSKILALSTAGVPSSPGPQSPLFEAELVASFEEELARHAHEANRNKPDRLAHPIDRKLYDPFEGFQKRNPPGGERSLVLYTTSLRGIKKTFDDCNAVRDTLQSFGVSIDERDVSMHLEFLNELRGLMGRMVTVPRVFIKGWYIGGLQDVSKLHEDGKLKELLVDLPKMPNQGICNGCDGVRFVPCLDCRGSCKIRNGANNMALRCPKCNENGLIQCPLCTTHLTTSRNM